jgi:hypothetical protein
VFENATNQECNGFDILQDNRIMIGILFQENLNYFANTYVLTENGIIDSTFADNGKMTTVLNNNEAGYSKVIELEDSRWILLGSNNYQGGIILSRITNSSLVPNITLNGSVMNSGITSNSVIHNWYLNGTEIEGNLMPTLNVSMNGEYAVTVIDTLYCGEYSDTLSINILESENIKSNRLLIYPNPTSKSFKVSGTYVNEYFSISDISGRQIKSGVIRNSNDVIDCSMLKEGIYIFNLHSGRHCKLIIKDK